MKIATKLKEYVDKAKLCEFRVLDSLKLTSSNSLCVSINRLAKSGEIYNPAKGIYVSVRADPFLAATLLKPGYISLSTALYLHHLIDEYPFTIYVASKSRGSSHLGEHEIFYFRAKNYLGTIEKKYKMASVEKALYDCLLHADFVGYAKIAKALYNAKISCAKFLLISKKESGAFFQRLGYVLSILPKRDAQKQKLLKFCRKMAKANTYLQGRKSGKYISEWKLIDNVGEKVILSWWQQ